MTSPDTDLSAASNYQLHNGEILFARTGASVGKSFIYRESDGLVYFAGFLIRARIRPEHDAEFVFQNTLGLPYEKYIQVTSQRSGQPGVNAQEYAEYSFMVPSLAEQKSIGSFLHQIDTLITLHQRKYDKLVAIKRSMLEKMFPREGSRFVAVFQRFGLPDLLILGNSVSYPKCSPATLIRLIFHMTDMSDLVFAAMPKEHFTAMCQRVTNYRPHRCTEWLQTSSS